MRITIQFSRVARWKPLLTKSLMETCLNLAKMLLPGQTEQEQRICFLFWILRNQSSRKNRYLVEAIPTVKHVSGNVMLWEGVFLWQKMVLKISIKWRKPAPECSGEKDSLKDSQDYFF